MDNLIIIINFRKYIIMWSLDLRLVVYYVTRNFIFINIMINYFVNFVIFPIFVNFFPICYYFYFLEIAFCIQIIHIVINFSKTLSTPVFTSKAKYHHVKNG